MRHWDDFFTMLLLFALSLALITMVAIETATHWTVMRSTELVLQDVAVNLRIDVQGGKPTLPEAAYRYLADLTAAQKGIRDAAGLELMYNLAVLGVIVVSGALYRRARQELRGARRLLADRQRAGDSSGEMHLLALDVSVAQSLAINIQCGSGKGIPTMAPVLRECMNEIHIGLVSLDRNGGWIGPVLYDRIIVGVRRVNTSLSRTVSTIGRPELADILARSRTVLALLRSSEFSVRCRRKAMKAKVDDDG